MLSFSAETPPPPLLVPPLHREIRKAGKQPGSWIDAWPSVLCVAVATAKELSAHHRAAVALLCFSWVSFLNIAALCLSATHFDRNQPNTESFVHEFNSWTVCAHHVPFGHPQSTHYTPSMLPLNALLCTLFAPTMHPFYVPSFGAHACPPLCPSMSIKHMYAGAIDKT